MDHEYGDEQMKAVAAEKDGTIHIVEIPIPSFNDYECLVRIKACGICNSTDMKLIENSVGDLMVEYPALLGHESVGEVVAVGNKVKAFKPGDRVVNPCGRLEPGTPYHSYWTAMAEYGIAHDIRAMMADGLPMPDGYDIEIPEDYPVRSIPPGMSDEDAVILLTVKENFSALKNFDMKPGKDVLIFGDGPAALGLACVARRMEVGYLGCAGHHDERLEKIKARSQADVVVNTNKQAMDDVIGQKKFDIIIDAVGGMGIVRKAAELLKPGGRVCVYGVLKKSQAELNLLDMPNNTCVQVYNRPYHEYRAHDEVCEWVSSGSLELSSFYSHVLPIDEAAKGFELVKRREAYKVILTM
jgi:threonine dehydrogenase-like Zn-dependent dehydrogenase